MKAGQVVYRTISNAKQVDYQILSKTKQVDNRTLSKTKQVNWKTVIKDCTIQKPAVLLSVPTRLAYRRRSSFSSWYFRFHLQQQISSRKLYLLKTSHVERETLSTTNHFVFRTSRIPNNNAIFVHFWLPWRAARRSCKASRQKSLCLNRQLSTWNLRKARQNQNCSSNPLS